jgi:hypothetical protein
MWKSKEFAFIARPGGVKDTTKALVGLPIPKIGILSGND